MLVGLAFHTTAFFCAAAGFFDIILACNSSKAGCCRLQMLARAICHPATSNLEPTQPFFTCLFDKLRYRNHLLKGKVSDNVNLLGILSATLHHGRARAHLLIS